jgi:hypothetical protein
VDTTFELHVFIRQPTSAFRADGSMRSAILLQSVFDIGDSNSMNEKRKTDLEIAFSVNLNDSVITPLPSISEGGICDTKYARRCAFISFDLPVDACLAVHVGTPGRFVQESKFVGAQESENAASLGVV